MPTLITAVTNSGGVQFGNPTTTDWDAVREATDGGTSTTTATTHSVFAIEVSGRGTPFFVINRYFLWIDLSGESGTVASASFNAYRNSDVAGNSEVWAVAHAATQGASKPDFPYIFLPSGDPSSDTIVPLADASNNGGTGWNNWTMNSAGLSAINAKVGSGTFSLALIADKDKTGNEPVGLGEQVRFRSDNYSGSYDPYVALTYATTAVADNATFFGANF